MTFSDLDRGLDMWCPWLVKYLDVPSSGSIADRTHSHNRAGQYTRNRRSPVQPVGTGRRGFIRAAFGSASAAWSALSGANRAAWDGFALDHPIVDALGQSIVLTGHQMFVACGTNLLNVGEALPSTPPATAAVPDLSLATLAASVSTGISIDDFTGSGSDFVTFAFSKQLNAGRSFNKTFWQPPGAAGYVAANGAPFTLASASYAAEFGTPVSGRRLFARLTGINAGGFASASLILQVLWTA